MASCAGGGYSRLRAAEEERIYLTTSAEGESEEKGRRFRHDAILSGFRWILSFFLLRWFPKIPFRLRQRTFLPADEASSG